MEAVRLDEYIGSVNSRQVRAEIVNRTTLRPLVKFDHNEIKEINVCHAYPAGTRYIRPGEHISGYRNEIPYRVVRPYYDRPGHPMQISSDDTYVYVANGRFDAETEVVFIGLTYNGFMRLNRP